MTFLNESVGTVQAPHHGGILANTTTLNLNATMMDTSRSLASQWHHWYVINYVLVTMATGEKCPVECLLITIITAITICNRTVNYTKHRHHLPFVCHNLFTLEIWEPLILTGFCSISFSIFDVIVTTASVVVKSIRIGCTNVSSSWKQGN